MQSRESESDSIWLCLEEVAQPGQPISFSQQTTQTQMSALSRDTAQSHCTQDEGRGMRRLGGLEVGMPLSCPQPQGMSMPWGSSVTSSESLP